MKKIILGVVLLILILTGIGIYSINGDKISKNVYVKDINIGNLTKDEAKDKLNKEYKMETFTFKYQDNSWNVKPEQIDISYDLEKTVDNAYNLNRRGNIIVNIFNTLKSISGSKSVVNVSVSCNKDKLNSQLEKISKDINVDVKNATLKIENNKVKIVKEENGLELDIDKTKDNFIKNIQNDNFDEILSVKEIEPQVKSSDLEKIDTLLGSYSTVLSDVSYERVENIKLAAKSTSDILLMPGEEFSYNEHTGPRSQKNGYKSAHVISAGEVAYGVGGGICQVSSTLFNSVLYAGLDIVSRTNHSIPSDYVALGRDATVSDSGIDFVFKNNYENPVFIKNYYKSGIMTCQIFGVKSDKQNIEITTKLNNTIEYKTVEKKDSSLSEGKTEVLERGRNGYTVTTYRIYYDENKKIIKKETVCISSYPSKNSVISVGTKKEKTKTIKNDNTSDNKEDSNNQDKEENSSNTVEPEPTEKEEDKTTAEVENMN